ncbi:hypothetical protein VP01_732g1 [Puccinia sorghi]|uniref:AAA+ ATPase domain-containing protein n=1 Tax=Puccinia sorghi TaxID=27349 RepID=A0A0L6UCX1_9BASI|nr:hypothetical protein VP01_732g1 [Puccinia sorghi]
MEMLQGVCKQETIFSQTDTVSSTFITSPICAKPIPSGDINRHLDSDHFDNATKAKPTTTAVQSTLNFQPSCPSDTQSKMTGSAKRLHSKTEHPDHHQPVLKSPSSSPPSIMVETPSQSRKKSRLNSDPSFKSSLPIPSSSYPSTFNKPLAERVRPKSLEEFKGQTHLRSTLRTLVASGNSSILWGPSGSGKTTLARCLKNSLNERENAQKYEFFELSATEFSTSEWKKIIDQHHLSSSANHSSVSHKKISSFYKSSSATSIPIIFIDEVQRLNKSQQDLFLPFIENGRMIMIFATTENPSFRLTTPLLSRCRLLKLNPHSPDEIRQILLRALEMEKSSSSSSVEVPSAMIDFLSDSADGDARVALSNLEIIIHALQLDPHLDHQALKEIIGKKFLLYDQSGDNHYELISALHKSVRGGDADAGLYWLARMLEGGEDPLYVARRLIRMASEDIGMSNPSALTQAVSAYQATQLIGMPECDCILAQVVVMLAESPKSVRTYKAYVTSSRLLFGLLIRRGTESTPVCRYKKAKAFVSSFPSYPVPLHLRNAPTKLMSDLGYFADYKYEPDYAHPIYQEFLPKEVVEMKGKLSKGGGGPAAGSACFLQPRSERIERQASSNENDNHHYHDDHSLTNRDGRVEPPPKDLDTLLANHQSDKWTTPDGKLVDLHLLRQWEVHFNQGQPWIGRHHLQPQ